MTHVEHMPLGRLGDEREARPADHHLPREGQAAGLAALEAGADPGDARWLAADEFLRVYDALGETDGLIEAIDAARGLDEGCMALVVALRVPSFGGLLAELVSAMAEMALRFEEDPSPVRCGGREVFRNSAGQPGVREVR